MKQRTVKLSDGRMALIDRHIVHEASGKHGEIKAIAWDDATRQNIVAVDEITRESRDVRPEAQTYWAQTGRERHWFACECIALETYNALTPWAAFSDDLTPIFRRGLRRIYRLCAKYGCDIIETDDHNAPVISVTIQRGDGRIFAEDHEEWAEFVIMGGEPPSPDDD